MGRRHGGNRFLYGVGEGDVADEDNLNLAILRWNRLKMAYARRNQVNQVSIKVHELDSNKKQLIRTVMGLVLGVISGLLMQLFLDKATLDIVDGSLITPLRDMLMNALRRPVLYAGRYPVL